MQAKRKSASLRMGRLHFFARLIETPAILNTNLLQNTGWARILLRLLNWLHIMGTFLCITHPGKSGTILSEEKVSTVFGELPYLVLKTG